MSLRVLSPLEARALAVLVEKQHTVPDSYPLSINSLTLGCNQKTARDPVINATEAEVLATVDELRRLHLVFEGSGSRVPRFEHNMGKVLGLPSQSVALLATLVLRGPQTSAELRLHCERLHRFADISAVEGFLDELATQEPVRVVKLARAPGAREARWAHLLCGEPQPTALPAGASSDDVVALGELLALKAEVARQGAQIDRLQAVVLRLATELGVSAEVKVP
jgi:uncharacterized protein